MEKAQGSSMVSPRITDLNTLSPTTRKVLFELPGTRSQVAKSTGLPLYVVGKALEHLAGLEIASKCPDQKWVALIALPKNPSVDSISQLELGGVA